MVLSDLSKCSASGAGHVADSDRICHILYHACSEKLAQTARSAEFDPERTFAPAINDNSIRMAIAKEIRELQDNVPVPERLTQRQPLRVTQGQCHMSCSMVLEGLVCLLRVTLGRCRCMLPSSAQKGAAGQQRRLQLCLAHREGRSHKLPVPERPM